MVPTWFEEFPAVYRAEMDTLRHGLPYFTLQHQFTSAETGERIAIQGELTYEEGKKRIVRVVFPHGYPHVPPDIIPLIQQIVGIQNNIPIFNWGPQFLGNNQYTMFDPWINGKMCLWDEEKDWEPFTDNVGTALLQAGAWLRGKEGGELAKDKVVAEDIPLIQEYKGQLLYNSSNPFPEGKEGKMFLKRFKENCYSLLQLQSASDKGINAIETFPDNTVLSPSKAEVIVGKWFRINGTEQQHLLPLAANFKNYIQQVFGIDINTLFTEPGSDEKLTIVSFIFEDQSRIHSFQLFYRKQGTTVSFQVSYLLPKDLSKELFARVESLFDLDFLFSKHILIVGAGSIGSETAKELASCNIGKYTLIDSKPYEAGNSSRHAADLRSVNEKKVDVLKQIIEARNPKAKVQVIPSSLFDIPLTLLDNLLQEADLVLDLTASKPVESYLHQKAFVARNIPVIQAAVSKGGLTGILLAMIPKESACLECLKEKKLHIVPTSTIASELLKETNPHYGICSKPALPASGIDTREVALQTARVSLQVLLRDEDTFYPKLQGYQYYWHGPGGSICGETIKKPFDWEIISATPNSNCPHCNKKNV